MTSDTRSDIRPAPTTGGEPAADLAADDTVLRQFVLQLAEASASVVDAGDAGAVHRTDHFVLADRRRPAGYFNSVVLQRPLSFDDWRSTMADIDGRVNLPGARGDVYLWSAWPTPDLHHRGWELVGHPPVLVRQPGGRLPEPAAGLRVSRVRSVEELHAWEQVAVDGYPFAELQPFRPGRLLGAGVLSDPRWSFWIGYEGDRPVTIGGLFVRSGFAYLGLGVTVPEARGRGYWYAMVRERLQAAPGLISGSMFSDLSRPGIQRLGYLPVTRLTAWRRPRP